jgi:phosphoribosylformylglycinamidine cyclo-ligase
VTSYREAGVDLDGAARHVVNIEDAVTATWAENVVGGFGGFAAGVQIPAGYVNPILMMSTDGVGTKLELARRSQQWAGVGNDLVAMCVDDLAAVGARPLGFVDYLAIGALDASRDAQIVASIASACNLAGCPLLGGETAEHPGVMAADAVDLAGAVMGVVDKGAQLGPDRVLEDDVVIGLRSPNLRSNGFSLIRSVFGDSVDGHVDQLLEPSVIYSPTVLASVETGGVHGAAHITGGGLAENLARTLPDGLGAVLDTNAWDRPGVFDLVMSRGVEPDDMWRTFNMGIGFCVVVDPATTQEVMFETRHHDPKVIGSVTPGSGVNLV